MPCLAFATCAARPGLDPDDALVVDHLPRDHRLIAVPWDDPLHDWSTVDAVLPRSTWDYHRRPAEFAGWLDALDDAAVRVWNPTPLLRWNLDKRYLRDLAARGVAVVPTVWLERGGRVDLAGVLDERGWERAVVKPAVGASSWGLRRIERRSAARCQPTLDEALAAGGVLIQPLLDEVGERGEWSLVFLAGELSHAVVKRAPAGELRVQAEFGGTVTPARPSPALARWAGRCLDAATRDSLYARVDAVETDAGPLLMELELIEPQLFLATAAGAAARFARALVARARRGSA